MVFLHNMGPLICARCTDTDCLCSYAFAFWLWRVIAQVSSIVSHHLFLSLSLSPSLALSLARALSLSPSPTLSLSYRTRAPERAVCPPQVFLLDCRLLPFQAAQEAAERQTLDRAERERARERSQGRASRGGCTLHANVCVCVHFTRMCPRQQRCRFLA